MFIYKSHTTLRLGLLAWLAMAFWTPVSGKTLEELEANVRNVKGGDPEAEYQLAIFLEEGKGHKKDTRRAIFLLNKAAQKGHQQAQNKLDNLISEIEAKAQKNDPESQFIFGYLLLKGKYGIRNNIDGFNWIIKASENGDSNAQYYLGHVFLGEAERVGLGDGNSYPPKDVGKGIYWLKQSAESGNLRAMEALFGMYIDGKNVEENHYEAFKLALEGVKLNSSTAAMSLGAMYLYGIGVEHDLEKALSYWHKSAELGYQTAKEFLGATYNPLIWEGWHPPPFGWSSDCFIAFNMASNVNIGIRDPKEAVKWLKEAASTSSYYGWKIECENAIGNAYFSGQGVSKGFFTEFHG